MRRLIVSLAILGVIIAVCAVNLYFVEGYVKETVKMLEKVSTYAHNGEYDKAAEYAKELEDLWTQTEQNLAFFVNDTKIAQIGEAIGRLPSLATRETAADFLAHADSAKVLLLHLYKAEQPSLPTVL